MLDQPGETLAMRLRRLYDAKDYKGVVAMTEALEGDDALDALALTICGGARCRLRDYKRAITDLEKAVEISPSYPGAWNNLGIAREQASDGPGAIKAFERALELKPDFAAAWNSLGVSLRFIGKDDEAEACYARAYRADPKLYEAHRNYSVVHSYKPGDPHLDTLRQLTPKVKDRTAQAHLNFALAKGLDDVGSWDEAFAAFQRGNEARRAELNYDRKRDAILFRWLHALFPTPRQTTATGGKVRPIFIVGMPRSGTTLMERILGAHPEVTACGELDHLDKAVIDILNRLIKEKKRPNGEDLGAIRKTYITRLVSDAPRAKVTTDKMPINFRWLGFVFEAMPEARVLNMRRDPMAVLWSNYRHYFIGPGNAFAYSFEDLAFYHAQYEALMEHWKSLYPDRILDVDYEALTEDQEGVSRAALEHVQLDWDPSCLDFASQGGSVKTASAAQVRQGIYKGSSKAWRAYEDHLAPLRELVEKAT